jgi:hypothetical protein
MPDPVDQFNDDIRSMARTVVGMDGSGEESLIGAVKHCAKTAGVSVGAAGAVAMAGAGAVTLPVVGAVPGWVAGALAGFVGGTAACTFAQRGVIHPSVRQLLSSNNRGTQDLRRETARLVRVSPKRSPAV